MSRVRGAVACLGAAVVGGSLAMGGAAVAAPGDVIFASDELRDCVNAASVPAMPAGSIVTESQASTVVALTCTGGQFTDLTGITALTSLETVDFSNGTVTDLSVLLTMPSVTTVTATGIHRTLPDIPVGIQQSNVVQAPHPLSPALIPISALPTSVLTLDSVRNWTFLDAHAAMAGEATLQWDANNLGLPGQIQFHFSGSITQSAIWLPPTMTTQPASASVLAGASASFTAAATSNQAPTVQWQQLVPGGSWEDIPGETGGTLAFASTVVGQSGTQYRAVFTNEAGVVNSDPATLTVLEPASYVTHPVAQSTSEGGAVQFRADFYSDSAAPQFRWEYSTDGGVTWADTADIPTADAADGPGRARALGLWEATLDLSGVTKDMNGWRFRVVVWDEYTDPALVSDDAPLTVTPVAVDPTPTPTPGVPSVPQDPGSASAPTVGSAPARGSAAPAAAAGRTLPRTGATVLPFALGAVALVVAGGAVLVVRRRGTSA